MKVKVKFNTWFGRIVGKLGYGAITLLWFIFPAKGKVSISDRLFNHECIHVRQQVEMGYLLQWLWYGVEYLIRLAYYRNHNKAYRNISFEREAYTNEYTRDYLRTRKCWAWFKYL